MSSLQGTWCAIAPSQQLRADSWSTPVDFAGKICYEFECTSIAPNSELCHFIEAYSSQLHLDEKVTAVKGYDIGAVARIGDVVKGGDFYDGSFYDLRLVSPKRLEGFFQEVNGSKDKNAFTGVLNLELQDNAPRPDFKKRFQAVAAAANA